MNAKKKGNKWERMVAAWLTSWSGFKFERNRAGSGSWWSNKDAVSDITCTDARHAHRCRISVECKSYKDIKFEHVLLGNKSCDILRFWEQASRDAKRTNKIPLLCMRYNSMPKGEFFLVVDMSLAPAFYKMMGETYMTLNTNEGVSLMVFMASKVKELVDYNDLHKEAKKLLKEQS